VPPIYTASRTPLRYLPYTTPADPNECPLTTKCTELLHCNCQLYTCKHFYCKEITSLADTSAVRKPLTAVQAASCSNYQYRHVGHMHHPTLRVRHLPILTAASSYNGRRLFSNHVFLKHSLVSGTTYATFPTTSSSGTPAGPPCSSTNPHGSIFLHYVMAWHSCGRFLLPILTTPT